MSDNLSTNKEFRLTIREIVQEIALAENGIILPNGNFDFHLFFDLMSRQVARSILRLATLEEPIVEIPADWWQHFKHRWFPRWLRRKFPVKTKWVSAVHKFPELEVPQGILGREFVHLRLVDSLEEILADKRNNNGE